MVSDAERIEDLAARFAACAIPLAEWTHEAHLTIGAWHVSRLEPTTALESLRAGIRRLNESHGTPNSETKGYHETITRAYVGLIAHFLATCPDAAPLYARVSALLAGPLGARDVLLHFYSRSLLTSPRARVEWVEPDLAPLGAGRVSNRNTVNS